MKRLELTLSDDDLRTLDDFRVLVLPRDSMTRTDGLRALIRNSSIITDHLLSAESDLLAGTVSNDES